MPFRRTMGIVSDSGTSNPVAEADVIMSAIVVGFAGSYAREGQPTQFDFDPVDKKNLQDWRSFTAIIDKLDAAVNDYLAASRTVPPAGVHFGTSPDYDVGGVIMGVYEIAGQEKPVPIAHPRLSAKGQALYQRIRDNEVAQYTGTGAYTGFVDNNNTTGNTDPIGPRPTARFLTPDPVLVAAADPGRGSAHPRWLPAAGSPVWSKRLRRNTDDSYVPWGMIRGDFAQVVPAAGKPNPRNATNEADRSADEMAAEGMAYNGIPGATDICAYSHGLVQAIYKAYSLGPGCAAYEIAVGDRTKKLASCIGCAVFAAGLGYTPTSIHLGRAESWAPLYEPYNPDGIAEEHELAAIRDLNRRFDRRCEELLDLGLIILDDAHIGDDAHKAARRAVVGYLEQNRSDSAVASALMLDALTVHDRELNRLERTLM